MVTVVPGDGRHSGEVCGRLNAVRWDMGQQRAQLTIGSDIFNFNTTLSYLHIKLLGDSVPHLLRWPVI